MRAARAYQSIDQHTSVIGADPLELVLLLYDKLLQRLAEAEMLLQAGDIAGKGQALGKAIELIEKGLIGALDHNQGGELAVQLKTQYALWMALLLRSNINSDMALLQQVQQQVKEVLAVWREVRMLNRTMR